MTFKKVRTVYKESKVNRYKFISKFHSNEYLILKLYKLLNVGKS